MAERWIGTVEHYFPRAHAALVHLEADLRVGDRIHVRGATTDFSERVPRIEIDHLPVRVARGGKDVGIEVGGAVRARDQVYLIT